MKTIRKERENRIKGIVLSWDLLKDFIIDRIEGLPKDVEIIGVRHDIFSMCDVIGLYSKEFEKIDRGVNPDPLDLYYEWEKCEKGKKQKILRVWIKKS